MRAGDPGPSVSRVMRPRTNDSPPPGTSGFRSARVRRAAARVAFVLLSAAIVVFWSEKAFWYPQGFGWPFGFLGLILAYALPVAVVLWTLDRVPASGWTTAVFAGALLALLVEGVITPVLYEGAPLPVLPAYFVGWHGVGSFVVLWYAMRRFLLAGNSGAVAVCSMLTGLVFGSWSLSWWLPAAADPSMIEAGWELGRWPVGRYGLYALLFTGVFAAGHFLVGYVWQRSFAPTRLGVLTVALGLAAFAIPTVIVLPWAPLYLGAFLALIWLALRRRARPGSPTLLQELAGTFPARRLWPLALLPASAVAVYAAASALEPSTALLEAVVLGGVPIATGLVGATTLAVAVWPSRAAGGRRFSSPQPPHSASRR